MLQSALLCWTSAPVSFIPAPRHFAFRIRVHPRQQLQLSSTSTAAGVPPPPPRSSVLLDSLRVLEWDKVCDAVASFAGTPLGRDATKELLWRLDFGYEDTKSLLAETAAAVEMIKYGAGGMDLGGIDVVHVKLAIDRASRGLPINGTEAIAISSLLEFSEMLQITVKTAIKEDSNWYNRFMPVAQVVMELIVNQPFVKLVRQMIDEDGSVKDNASSELKRFRDQVLRLEQKLYQLMDKLIRSDRDDVYSGEVSTINGRWCIKSTIDRYSTFEGLLLSSNKSFENACVEFDEVNLKPTYKILWGVPGRSNALNIAERLGLPNVVLRSAHKLYGKASMEINGAIVDMERLKQEFQQHFHEAQHYMKLSRKNYESLLASKQKIHEYSIIQNNKKVQAILGAAAVARSLLHAKLQVFRETSAIHTRKEETSDNMAYSSEHFELPSLDSSAPETFKSPAPGLLSNQKPSTIPQVGDMVDVPTLGKKGMVLKVEASKGEIVVQAGNMKLRLKLSNFVTQEVNTL